MCLFLLEYTALQGNSAAMNGLGCFYASGYGCIKNVQLSFEWSEKSAMLGCSVRCREDLFYFFLMIYYCVLFWCVEIRPSDDILFLFLKKYFVVLFLVELGCDDQCWSLL